MASVLLPAPRKKHKSQTEDLRQVVTGCLRRALAHLSGQIKDATWLCGLGLSVACLVYEGFLPHAGSMDRNAAKMSAEMVEWLWLIDSRCLVYSATARHSTFGIQRNLNYSYVRLKAARPAAFRV